MDENQWFSVIKLAILIAIKINPLIRKELKMLYLVLMLEKTVIFLKNVA